MHLFARLLAPGGSQAEQGFASPWDATPAWSSTPRSRNVLNLNASTSLLLLTSLLDEEAAGICSNLRNVSELSFISLDWNSITNTNPLQKYFCRYMSLCVCANMTILNDTFTSHCILLIVPIHNIAGRRACYLRSIWELPFTSLAWKIITKGKLDLAIPLWVNVVCLF